MKRENYLHIAGWMLELGLKRRTELEIFALIYGFSQSGQGEFIGSLTYIAEMIGIDRSSVSRALNSLVEKNLIIKNVYGKRCSNGYQVNQEEYEKILRDIDNRTSNKMLLVSECNQLQNATSGEMQLVENCNQLQNATSCKMLPVYKDNINNLININNNNNIKESLSNERDKKSEQKCSLPPTPKHKYGEYQNVLLTDAEVEKLQKEIPNYEDYIESLSSYIASKGTKYKSHYATIRNWYRKDLKENGEAKGKPKPKSCSWSNYENQTNYDFDEYERELLGH